MKGTLWRNPATLVGGFDSIVSAGNGHRIGCRKRRVESPATIRQCQERPLARVAGLQRSMSIENIIKISDALGLSVDALVRGILEEMVAATV